jgi:PAS domain S-box-containing protein
MGESNKKKGVNSDPGVYSPYGGRCEAQVIWDGIARTVRLFFTPPVFPEDEEKTRQARLLHALLVGALLLLSFGGAAVVAFFYVEKFLNSILIAIVFAVMCLAYWMMRAGRVRPASYLFLYGLWPVFTVIVLFSGGMPNVVAAFFVVLVTIAGLLLGFRGALIYSVFCCLSGLAMVLLDATGRTPPRLFPVPSFVGWLDLTVVLIMTTLTIHFAVRDLNTALDITRRRLEERRLAEEALRESEERFARMSSAACEGILIIDQERIIDANPQSAHMMGCEPEAVIGMNFLDFVAPDSRDLVAAKLRAGMEEQYEYMAVRKDGTRFPVAVRSKPIPYGGRMLRVNVILDITERREAEAGLLRQMERLRALHTIERAIAGSMDLQVVLDLLAREVIGQLHMDATSILLWEENEQTLNFAAGEGFRTHALRYTKLKIGDGLAGQAARTKTVVHIPDLAAVRGHPALAESIVGEGFAAYFGIPLIAKGRFCGVMEIFQRTARELGDDWLPFLEILAGQAAIAIDNARLMELTQTNLKETEALYRINRGLVASIEPLRLMQDVVILLQESFNYFYVQIYVRDPGTGDFVVRAGSGEIGKKLIAKGHRLAAGEGIVGHTAKTGAPFLTNNVDEVVFFLRNALLPDTKSELAVPIQIDGQFLGLLDIQQVPPFTLTRRDLQLVGSVANQLAVALQKAQLYTDLQNSLRQEKEMRAQLVHSEKLAVTGRLMASVSHELNNPLQAIQNALFLLKDERTISAQAKKDLAVVLSETDRMAVMLDRLRTTYKAVRMEDFLPVRINDVIEDVHALMATHLRHAGIAFEFHADPALPPVSGAGDHLRQVVLNLFMNAVDAMPKGGRLEVSTEGRADDGEIRISVSDTGEGIDPAIMPHIFETFISGKENGTGLGLAICYEIVNSHKGRIQAENRAEGGARFQVWLPVLKEVKEGGK